MSSKLNATTASGGSPPSILTSKNDMYSLKTHIKGHKGLVLCMAATDDGKLASGGQDGVRVWDLRRAIGQRNPDFGQISQFSRPSGAGDRGATTALAWIQREDEPDDGLVYGTLGGYIVCWKEVSGRETTYVESFCALGVDPGEITAITFDPASNRLVVSNRSSVISLFEIGSRMDLRPVFNVTIKNHVPKALAFGNLGDNKEIYSFGLYDGVIHTLSGSDGKVQDTRYTGCRIGNVSANLRRNVICLDDPSEGVAAYRYDSWLRVRTYPVAVSKSMRPRQLRLIENCKFIICGSDHGVMYIFDRRTGNMVDELKAGNDRVQAITATENTESPYIFSAMSQNGGTDGPCSIAIWCKNREVPVVQHVGADKTPPLIPSTSPFNLVIQACFIAMALAFIYQNSARFMFW